MTVKRYSDGYWDTINIKSYGAKGNGTTNDTAAFQAAFAAVPATGGEVYIPPGVYVLDTVNIPNWTHLRGAGPGATILKSRVGATVLQIDNSTSVDFITRDIKIEDLAVKGVYGVGSHGIAFVDAGGTFNITLNNVYVFEVGGKGIYMPRSFTVRLTDVQVNFSGDNAIEIQGGNSTVLERCFVWEVPAGKCGYRIYSGNPVLIACNGITGNNSPTWGVFGQNIAEDGVVNACDVVLQGCNIEAFTETGIRLKSQSSVQLISTKINNTHDNTVALQFDGDNGSGVRSTMFSPFQLFNEGTWKDGYPIHVTEGGAPIMTFGKTDTGGAGIEWLSYYNDTQAEVFDLPTTSLYQSAYGGSFVKTSKLWVDTLQSDLVINVRAFGAVGDGIADDTIPIQAAINATPYGGELLIPPGTYKLAGVGSTLLTVSLPMTIRGTNMLGSQLIIDSSVGNSTDVLTMSAAGNNEGLVLRDFTIVPNSGTPGRNGIVFDCEAAGRSWSGVKIDHVYVRTPAGRALHVKNPNLDHDAFFRVSIVDSVFAGGMLLDGSGDSVNIHRNTLTTAANAITAGKGAGVELRHVSENDPQPYGDSSMTSIAYNNITATGGSVWVRAAQRLSINNNNCEVPFDITTNPGLAMIDLDGDATHIIDSPEITHNYLGTTTHHVNHAIRVNYATNVDIDRNTIQASGGYGAFNEVYPTPNAPAAATVNLPVGLWYFSVVGAGSQEIVANTGTATGLGTATELIPLQIYVTVEGTFDLQAITPPLTSASLNGPYDPQWYGILATGNAGTIRVRVNTWPVSTWTGQEYRYIASNAGQTWVEQFPYRFAVTPVYQATIAEIDQSLGDAYIITATDGNAFTIPDPNLPYTGLRTQPNWTGHEIEFTIKNAAGAPLGVLTWGAGAYKMAAWVQPADGYSRSIKFRWNGTNWVETWRSMIDIPN